MNTVDALLELGKALCGNDFELAPNMTDAEAIREIARNYQPPEGGGSGGDLLYDIDFLIGGTQLSPVITYSGDLEDIAEALNSGKTLRVTSKDATTSEIINVETWNGADVVILKSESTDDVESVSLTTVVQAYEGAKGIYVTCITLNADSSVTMDGFSMS